MEEKNNAWLITGESKLTPVVVNDVFNLKSVMWDDTKFLIFIDNPFG